MVLVNIKFNKISISCIVGLKHAKKTFGIVEGKKFVLGEIRNQSLNTLAHDHPLLDKG